MLADCSAQTDDEQIPPVNKVILTTLIKGLLCSMELTSLSRTQWNIRIGFDAFSGHALTIPPSMLLNTILAQATQTMDNRETQTEEQERIMESSMTQTSTGDRMLSAHLPLYSTLICWFNYPTRQTQRELPCPKTLQPVHGQMKYYTLVPIKSCWLRIFWQMN